MSEGGRREREGEEGVGLRNGWGQGEMSAVERVWFALGEDARWETTQSRQRRG